MRRGAGKLVVVLLAVAWTVGLRAAVRWHARRSGVTMDDSSESSADARRLIARLPPLTPPLRELGAGDAEGADAKMLLTLLRAERTSELEVILDEMGASLERDPARESGVERALHGLSFARTRELTTLDRWVERTPRSFAARLARGAARVLPPEGGACKPVSGSTGTNLGHAALARDDLETALELRPDFVPAMTLMMKTFPREDWQRRQRVLDRAFSACPRCVGPSIEHMVALLSSDAAGAEIARAFAEQAQPRVETAPRLRALMGYLDWHEAGRLQAEKNWEGALAACDRALASFPEPEFARRKAVVLLSLERHQDSVDALDAVLEADPYDVDARIVRARGYVRLKRYQPASDDLRLALQLAPEHAYATELYGWLVRQLAYEIQRTLRSGDLEGALETYDEALLAVPEQSELRPARHALAARLGPPYQEYRAP
jgi:tetratricopeptide (TPR) repeat protein